MERIRSYHTPTIGNADAQEASQRRNDDERRKKLQEKWKKDEE